MRIAIYTAYFFKKSYSLFSYVLALGAHSFSHLLDAAAKKERVLP